MIFPFLLLLSLTLSSCPNSCNGHGSCATNQVCNCFPSWTEGDCSKRTCPYGEQYADTEEHTSAFTKECSGQGLCDRTNGLCQCFDGFHGNACQKLKCEDDCSGHGVCLPISYLNVNTMSHFRDFYEGTGKYQPNKYEGWDKDSYKCVCDKEYTGYKCHEKKCLSGYMRSSDCDAEAQSTQTIWFGRTDNSKPMIGCLAYARYTDNFGRNWITPAFNILKNITETDLSEDSKNCVKAANDLNYPSLEEALNLLPPGTIDLESVEFSKGKDTTIVITIQFGSQQTGKQQQLHIYQRSELTFREAEHLKEAIPTKYDDDKNECTEKSKLSECAKYVQQPNYIEETTFNYPESTSVPPLECSNNGLCDRLSGLCQCFTGYYGLACSQQTPIQ